MSTQAATKDEALYKGKRHYDEHGNPLGGIKVVVDDSYVVEVEGGEYAICREAFNSDKILEFHEKTNKEILDYIHNVTSCEFNPHAADSGDFILCRLVVLDPKKHNRKGTVRQILDEMQAEHSCRISNGEDKMKDGGKVAPKVATPAELKQRWAKKKEHIGQMAESIRSLRNNLTRDIKFDDEKTRLTALAIAVIDRTAERVGNNESAENGHIGVTGFEKSNIKIDGNTVFLHYVGKSGVEHEKQFSDEFIASALKDAIKNSNCEYVFCTSDGFRIQPEKINRYLSSFGVTAKDLRGFQANKILIDKLRNIDPKDIGETEAKRKKKFNKILKYAAMRVGHGASTLRTHYMMPELEKQFVEHGKIIDLKDYYKEGGDVKMEDGGYVEKEIAPTVRAQQANRIERDFSKPVKDKLSSRTLSDKKTELWGSSYQGIALEHSVSNSKNKNKFTNGGNILLAPNGQPSNLSPEQYHLVRTPEFINFFGYWNKDGFADKLLASANNVIIKTPTNRPIDRHTEMKLYRVLPRMITLLGFDREININREAYRHTLQHGRRDEVFYSLYNLEELCANAVFFDYEHNHDAISEKDYIQGVECYFCLATFRSESCIVRLTVNVGKDGKRFLYDINVEKKESPKKPVKDKQSSRTLFGDFEIKDRKFKQLIQTFPENISKVVDENGEPLVVWHGSPKKFTSFDSKMNVGTGFYLSGSKDYASQYGSVTPYFLNCKKMLIATESEVNAGSADPITAKEKGYDGFAISYDDGTCDYTVYQPEQIKLADGTNTTFDPKNADMRYEDGGEIDPAKPQTVGCLIYHPKHGYLILQRGVLGEETDKLWHILSGGVDEGEELEITVRREIAEEIGYEGEMYMEHIESLPFDDYVFHYFYVELSDPIEIVLDFENLDYQWVDSVTEMLEYNLIPKLADYIEDFGYSLSRYKSGGTIELDKRQIYKKWKSLVNMSKKELEDFYNSEEGKRAGLSASEAHKLGIHYGRESAKWILRMKSIPSHEWTPKMWEWAKRQINFITRMSGNAGELIGENGEKTRKYLSLLIWGNDPNKKMEGGELSPIEFKAKSHRYFEYVPIEELLPYREFDREVEHKWNKDELNQLTKKIAKNGITEPVQLQVHGGYGLISEGNHRLASAKRLGIKYIPTYIYDSDRDFGSINKHRAKKLPDATYRKAKDAGISILNIDRSPMAYGFNSLLPAEVKKLSKGGGIHLYHGSNKNFDEFSEELVSTGDEADLFGKGFYLTDNKKIAEVYAKSRAMKEHITHYTPTGIFKTAMPHYKKDAEELAEKEKYVNEFKVHGKILDAETYLIPEPFKEKILDLWVKYSGFDRQSGEKTFEYLRNNKEQIHAYRGELWYIIRQIGFAEKRIVEGIAEYIRAMGYDGIKYPSDREDYEKENGYNYVIFDKKKIEKVLEDGGELGKSAKEKLKELLFMMRMQKAIADKIEKLDDEPTAAQEMKYAYKKDDKVVFYKSADNLVTAKIVAPSTYIDGVQTWLTDKGLVAEHNMLPEIVSAKKESKGQGYKAFKGLGGGGSQYVIRFADGRTYSTTRTDDRKDAIEEAVRHRLRIVKDYPESKQIEMPVTVKKEDATEEKPSLSLEYDFAAIPNNQVQFVASLFVSMENSDKHNKVSLEHLAKQFNIEDKNTVKELAELTICLLARGIAQQDLTEKEKFDKMVELYHNQANLSHRTSQSMMLQQYSTPVPIGYVMGLYCGFNHTGKFFEPSAGNGNLLVAGDPKDFVVNEIDEQRNADLRFQGFKEVLSQDASHPFHMFDKKFDGVITNPPFGAIEPIDYDGYKISSLEQHMALIALQTMQDDGKCAIIIGSHTEWDELGRIQGGKNRIFFSLLYRLYNVEDVINIDGHALYSRQGTAFDTRIILINGRKKVQGGFPPLLDKKLEATDNESGKTVMSFEQLWERVARLLN